MAINTRYQIKQPNGKYEIVHFETSADQVTFVNGKTLQQTIDNGDLKGEKGDQGDNGVYVGTLDDAPDTANIVIDDTDEGLFFEGFVPDIQIGEVTTLEPDEKATITKRGTLETPIFDFAIPRGKDAEIDDTTISTDTTWSSEKIEDFVLTNDDAVWTEVSGENLSIDYTKEGYLREVEIWGNTIQNAEDLSDIQHLGTWNELKQGYEIEIKITNGNLIQDLDDWTIGKHLNTGGMEAVAPNGCYTNYYIPVKESTNYTINAKTSNNTFIVYFIFYDSNKTYISRTGANNTKPTVTSPENAKYVRVSFYSIENYDNRELLELCFEETTTFEGYREPQSYKTTILLPCQLEKIGDVYDRLYWDSEKGKYVVEKADKELIDTNITEQIKLPTYKDKTHIFVTGGIDGSIKAKAPLDGGQAILSLSQENKELKSVNQTQDELINISLLATDEMCMLLEPLLVQNVNLSNKGGMSKIVDMYVAMVQRGLKKIEDVPKRYKTEVFNIINNKELEV